MDDPRNTDNSWMETIAYNFHDESGTSVANFKLHAGESNKMKLFVDEIANVRNNVLNSHQSVDFEKDK